MSKKKIEIAQNSEKTAIASMPAETIAPMLGSQNALLKLPGTGGDILREEGVTLVTGRSYATRDGAFPVDEIYFVKGSKPQGEGPWLGEADKLSWHDEETGLECIMLRDVNGGHLCGYVGVPRDHPLWGWGHEAVPVELGISVHGGLNYSRICDGGPRPDKRLAGESLRICHPGKSHVSYRPMRHATEHRADDPHAWWFGFSCDHIYDVVPKDAADRKRFLGPETGAEYRDDAYVVREILNLARQLRAVADGNEMPLRDGAPLPPSGLDPRKGS